MVMPFTAMGQLIRIHFGEKTASVLDKLNLKCLFHTQVEKPQQIYITQIFISFLHISISEPHGKVRGKDRSHESQQYNTASTEALKHTTPSSCAAVKFLVIFHTPVQTSSPKEIFPYHPRLIPFFHVLQIFPSNT